MNAKAFFLIAVAVCAVATAASAADSQPEDPSDVFTLIVAHLNRFQAQDGGFHLNGNENPSVEATERALFLTSLFGTRARINAYEASRFVESALNTDNGFGTRPGAPSTVSATHAATLAYLHLGQAIPSVEKIAAFVETLWDSSSNQFANQSGGRGDLRSTALALQILKNTGALDSSFAKGILPKVRAVLSEKLVNDKNGSHFAFDGESGAATSTNYYATLAATLTNYKFSDASAHARYVKDLQCLDETSPGNFGGFYTDSTRSTVQFDVTGHAMATLKLLGEASNKKDLVNSIDNEALSSFVSGAPEDIGALAACHYAVAVTDTFTSTFKETMLYDVDGQPAKKSFVQGAQFKPVFALTYGGVPHGALDVDVTITPPSAVAEKADGETFKLSLNAENQIFIADELYDTDDELGDIAFEFTARYFVVGVGEISFKFSDKKSVGYRVVIDAKATHNGEEVESDEIQIGTEFDVHVTLSTRQDSDLLAGDFTVNFDVVDAAGASISNQKKQGKGNTDPYTFAYALKDSNIPSGAVSLRVTVADASGNVHSEESVSYKVDLKMVAADVDLTDFKSGKAPTFKLGQTIKASFVPATLPDLRTLNRFSSAQKDDRKFFLDIVTAEGAQLIASIGGKAADAKGNSKYNFEYTIGADFDNIGAANLQFRFVDADGNSQVLDTYDSTHEEIASSPISYNVNAKLDLADVTSKPESTSFDYGAAVTFAFKVKDTVSGKFLKAGQLAGSTAYLVLTAGKTRSVAVPATASGESFTISWTVNANAAAGASTLSLEGQNGGGASLPINQGGKAYALNVKVGGTINVEHSTYTTANPDATRAFFVTSFSLSCKGNDLPGADLLANVLRQSGSGYEVVAENVAVTGAGANYQATWSPKHADAPAGTYKVAVFRASDRGAAHGTDNSGSVPSATDSDEFSSGSVFSASSTVGESASSKVLFASVFSHNGQASRSIISLRIEYFAVIGLGFLFYYVNQQKNALSL